ncbi:MULTISPECIES: sulfite exporter TauE/SafE family protein [unclassified Actinopolyspora]|uniref:sulfite exporter TauE/SafE family protein n=1 Tax=unclassified Actinopolyspora TaxID=2639451 RepID=UPI0013F60E58|nr:MULTISPECIES: sulfite exporter TauE/SafE family protein [unclassified Actinopolyspora]NHD15639.1 sulfite exporter TauE/SafE family protein [Actinopolyspora sp. BKK2]NHE75148.1 sulfite exporter TauE/SafE family protein [Actinopolyspora sp. BKK1]
MPSFVLLALAGVAGQLIDGALGMAFGLTSTTMLLTVGLAPAVASASTHLAELGTTLASGVSHWGFGNIDWPKIGWLAVPGAVSAFVGATFLTSIPAKAAEPVVAIILFGMGVYILARFAFTRTGAVRVRHVPRWFLSPLAVVAGFMDAVGGGGWGPVGSSSLLASGRMEPRKVVGTVAASEFLVTVGASAGFLLGLSTSEIPLQVVAALLLGGAVAAPFAAWVVRLLNARVMGTLVGGIIVLTNTRTFLRAIGFDDVAGLPVYIALAVGWLAALAIAVHSARRDRTDQQSKSANLVHQT